MIKLDSVFLKAIILGLLVSNIAFAQKINQLDENGKRTGVWKKKYKNGNIRYKGQFENGKEVGVFKFYSIRSKSQPTIVKDFSGADGLANVKFYTRHGKLKSEGKMLGKKREGKWLYYFLDGHVMSEENFTDNEYNGVVKNYYPNGRLTEETYYQHGLKHGTSKIYTESGTLLEALIYDNGKLNGEAKYFDVKGALKEKGMYKDGKRVGKWEFYIDGQLAKKKKEKLSEFKN
ncbi:MAG TPA: hypothetical protein DDY16_07805 [Tenacibaculum sp.]|nr:hypothetical protein [Tenacibaculum sp.]